MADPGLTLRRAWRRSLFIVSRTLVRLFGFVGTRHLGAALAAIQYRFGAKTRRRCLHDLALLQNRTPGDPLVARQLREAYRVSTVSVLQVLSMFDRRVDDAVLKSQCRVDGLQRLEAARAAGGGAILLATHSGNSLLLVAQLASAGWPMTLIYRQARMMSADFFAQGLPKYGIEGILANEGLKAYATMASALRRNRIVFAMMDQGVKLAKDGLPMRFLGKDMPMPGGVAQLARSSRAPVLPVVALAAEPAWHFSIQAPVPLEPGTTLEEDVAMLLRMTERQVLEHPELWSWHHRRWRKFPLATAPSG